MLAYLAPLRPGTECPHCTHVIRPDENPQEHFDLFHRDRAEAEDEYRAAIARGESILAARAAYNTVLALKEPPGPGKYDRVAFQVSA